MERLSFIAHVINILLIFMPAWESFSTIKILLEKSRKIKNNIDNNNSLRWQIPQDSKEQAQIITTFIDFFISQNSESNT